MEYFTIKELTRSAYAKSNGIDNTPERSHVKAMTALVENVLDPLRRAYGKPITVNSGYRSERLNKAVGGVPTSQHLKGEAADITTGTLAGNVKLFNLAKSLGLPYDQLIDERGYKWLHISYKADGENRRQVLHA